MYRIPEFRATSIQIDNSYEGETIEQKVERIISNKEPITDGAPIIHQERNEGVAPSYDIRTDRFEVAVEAMDKVHASKQATREEKVKEYNEKMKKKDGSKDDKKEGKNTEGESVQGTSGEGSQSTEK